MTTSAGKSPDTAQHADETQDPIHQDDIGSTSTLNDENVNEKPKSEETTATPPTSTPQLTDQTQRLPFAQLIVAYLCLATTFFVSFLDVNSTATALPAIARSLNASNTITWAGTAYLLSQCAFQVLYGRMADIFGRKPVLIGCIASLIVGDILCGFAQNGPWLYTCRAISGIGGGGISSLVQITVSDLVSLKERGKYQGMLSASIGLGAGVGPFIAAALLSRGDEEWRWAFWVPAMLAALCTIPLIIFLPQKPVVGHWKEKVKKIDGLGMFTAIVGILFLLIPVNSGGSVFPWNSPLVIAMLTIGSILSISFVLVEWKVAKLPMLPLRLFKSLSRSTIFTQNFLFGFVWQADIYFLPIYYQSVRGYDPVRSAYLTIPLLLAQSAGGVLSAPSMSYLGRYLPMLWFGFILWLIGAGLKLLFSRSTPIAVYVVAVLIEGLGVGFVFQPSLVALQALSPKPDVAVTTSARNWTRALGSAVGVAICTAINYAVMKSSLPPGIPESVYNQVLNGSWVIGESPAWDDAILDAKMKGINRVFITFVPLIGLCLLGCLWVKDKRLLGDGEKEKKDEEKGEGQKRRTIKLGRTIIRE